jgi:hypothetical protein
MEHDGRVWVRLAEWMIVDGEPPLPEVGSVLPHLGIRAYGAIAPVHESEADGFVGVDEGSPADAQYRVTGRVESPRDFSVDEGRGARHAGVEFVIVVGPTRFHVQADGRATDIANASRLTVTGSLRVIGTYEWEAFDLAECRADWRVERVVRTGNGDALLDIVPATSRYE